MALIWLNPFRNDFPEPERSASKDVIAAGGDLSPARLLAAYKNGIFPWYNEDEPILWWSPDPRMVLLPHQLKVAKSMRPLFNQQKFTVTYNTQFKQVMVNCRENDRKGQSGGSWINDEMIEAYSVLNEWGYAHSVEVWEDGALVGGLYGIAIGKLFFGESMFTKVSNASKYGFISLVEALKKRDFKLIDCQQETQHLTSLGGQMMSRKEFMAFVRANGEDILDLAPSSNDYKISNID
jgi:leucyl/phenylalanyl-tRNA---protein transferase